MRIGIDARMLGERGIGRYIEQLILNLEKIDNENQYFVFLTKENFDKYNPTGFNFNKILADFKWYSFSEQISFPKLLKKYKLDLVHFTHFNVPISYNKPFIQRGVFYRFYIQRLRENKVFLLFFLEAIVSINKAGRSA